MSEETTTFDYLLNAFEQASQSDNPAANEYGAKRRALLAHVRDLERRAPLAQQAGEDARAAARYRWLRANWGYVCETYDGDRATEVFLVDKADGWDTEPDSLDAAIDHAMSADNMKGGT